MLILLKINRDFFSKLMPKNIKNKKVLEIGCGLGAHTEALVQKKLL